MIQLRSVEVRLYLLGDSVYPSGPYLLKDFKIGNNKLREKA